MTLIYDDRPFTLVLVSQNVPRTDSSATYNNLKVLQDTFLSPLSVNMTFESLWLMCTVPRSSLKVPTVEDYISLKASDKKSEILHCNQANETYLSQTGFES